VSERIKIRNAAAVAAHFRRAATFDHKCAPRGGAKNTQREILRELSGEAEASNDSPFWELQFQTENG
jgi:hypothetical protein